MNSTAPHPGIPTTAGAAARADTVPTLHQAVARLEQSRDRLRQSLAPAPVSAGERRSWRPVRRARAWLRGSTVGSMLEPVLGGMVDELMEWWDRQGWRQSATHAKQAFSAEVVPLVRRHPIAAVLVTAAAGALIAGSGVWRWRVIKRGLSHMGSTLGGQLRHLGTSQLSNPAVQGLLLSALLSFIGPRIKRKAASTPTQASTPGATPGGEEQAPFDASAAQRAGTPNGPSPANAV